MEKRQAVINNNTKSDRIEKNAVGICYGILYSVMLFALVFMNMLLLYTEKKQSTAALIIAFIISVVSIPMFFIFENNILKATGRKTPFAVAYFGTVAVIAAAGMAFLSDCVFTDAVGRFMSSPDIIWRYAYFEICGAAILTLMIRIIIEMSAYIRKAL